MTCNYNPCTDGTTTAEDYVGTLPLTGSSLVNILVLVAVVLIVMGVAAWVASVISKRRAL